MDQANGCMTLLRTKSKNSSVFPKPYSSENIDQLNICLHNIMDSTKNMIPEKESAPEWSLVTKLKEISFLYIKLSTNLKNKWNSKQINYFHSSTLLV